MLKISVDGVERDATPEEIADWEFHKNRDRKMQYVWQRQEAYPPIVDYLDGVVKGDQAQVQAYIDACLAVKARFPKPTE